jgi:hypothetical protein
VGHRPAIPPPTLCSAVAKSTGQGCKRWARPGSTICSMHGMNGRTKDSADAKRLLAVLLQSDPRPVWRVLLDSVHTADSMVREVKAHVLAGEPVTVDLLDRLESYTRLSFNLSSAAVTTRAAEIQAQQIQRAPSLDASDGRLVDVLDGLINRLADAFGHDLDRRRELVSWGRLSAAAVLDGQVPEPVPMPPALEGAEIVVEADLVDGAESVGEPLDGDLHLRNSAEPAEARTEPADVLPASPHPGEDADDPSGNGAVLVPFPGKPWLPITARSWGSDDAS